MTVPIIARIDFHVKRDKFVEGNKKIQGIYKIGSYVLWKNIETCFYLAEKNDNSCGIKKNNSG